MEIRVYNYCVLQLLKLTMTMLCKVCLYRMLKVYIFVNMQVLATCRQVKKVLILSLIEITGKELTQMVVDNTKHKCVAYRSYVV